MTKFERALLTTLYIELDKACQNISSAVDKETFFLAWHDYWKTRHIVESINIDARRNYKTKIGKELEESLDNLDAMAQIHKIDTAERLGIS